MDVASTSFSLLRTVTITFLEKLEQVEQLEKSELKFARQYKKSVSVLMEDANNFSIRLDAIIKHGNDIAVKKLLGSAGDRSGLDALDELTKYINSTRDFLQKQDGAVREMLSKLSERKGKDMSNVLVDVLTANNRESAFRNAKEDALSTLESYRGDLRRHFDHFHDLYDIILTGVQVSSPTPLSREPLEERSERHFHKSDVNGAFDEHPFQLSLDKDTAMQVASDIEISPIESNVPGSYASFMKWKGSSWVKENRSDVMSVANLTDLQTSLLKEVVAGIDSELAAAKTKVDVPDKSASDKKRCEHLEGMSEMIWKEINRVQNQRFSIAFCGMVKAG